MIDDREQDLFTKFVTCSSQKIDKLKARSPDPIRSKRVKTNGKSELSLRFNGNHFCFRKEYSRGE